MWGADAVLPSGPPRRTVSLAVGGGAAGIECVRRIAQRLGASVRDPFEVRPLIATKEENPDDAEDVIRLLLAGKAELAACCAERLPVKVPPRVRLEAALRVYDPRYRLYTLSGQPNLDALEAGARIGVCDATARAQLLYLKPSLRVELADRESLLAAGLASGEWDAAIGSALLAETPGLGAAILPYAQLAPPAGRGVIALLALDEADPAEPWRRLLNEPETEDCLLCERAFLGRVASGARGIPIAHAARVGGRLELDGSLAHPDGEWLVTSSASGPPSFGRIMGLEVAESCRELAARRVRLPAVIPGGSRA